MYPYKHQNPSKETPHRNSADRFTRIPRRAAVLGMLTPLLGAGVPYAVTRDEKVAGIEESASWVDSSSTSSAPALDSSEEDDQQKAALPESINPIEVAHPWDEPQTALEGAGNYIAWTVDDGKSPDVVRAYADFAARTGTRLTFFINGLYNAFEPNLDVLKPLVESGQIQIGNHTWSHAALTTLDDAGIAEELTKNDEEIQRLFGVSSKPYYRPPYGYYDSRVLEAAAGAGFDRAVLWYGSLADSSPIPAEEIYAYSKKYANSQTILIGHLNYPGVIEVLDKIKMLLDERNLTPVTLRDYYG